MACKTSPQRTPSYLLADLLYCLHGKEFIMSWTIVLDADKIICECTMQIRAWSIWETWFSMARATWAQLVTSRPLYRFVGTKDLHMYKCKIRFEEFPITILTAKRPNFSNIITKPKLTPCCVELVVSQGYWVAVTSFQTAPLQFECVFSVRCIWKLVSKAWNCKYVRNVNV